MENQRHDVKEEFSFVREGLFGNRKDRVEGHYNLSLSVLLITRKAAILFTSIALRVVNINKREKQQILIATVLTPLCLLYGFH